MLEISSAFKKREKFVVVRFSLKELYRGGEGEWVRKKRRRERGLGREGRVRLL